MGLFDRSPKPPRPPLSPAEHVQVPPGHEVRICAASDTPLVSTLPGGAIVACTGRSPLPSIEVIGGLLARVEEALTEPPRPLLLSSGAGPLSSLFAPSDPAVHEIEGGGIVWSIGPGFLPWTRDAQRCRAVLERIRQVAWVRGAASPSLVSVYLDDATSPEGRRSSARLRQLGFRPRSPDAGGALLAEVQRPEGMVLTALLGSLLPELPPAEPPDAPPVVLERAFCPRALAAAVVEGKSDQAFAALCKELLAERHALLLLADVGPDQKATVPARSWEGLGEGTGVYFDLESLHKAAADMGKKKGSYGAISMTTRKLCRWALEQPTALALGVRVEDEQLFVALREEPLRRLAQGEVPEGPE